MASIVTVPDEFRGMNLPGALNYYVVSDASSIETRVENASAGDVIGVRGGSYNFSGTILADNSGTIDHPIYLIGLDRNVTFVGPDYTTNMQLFRIQANFWRMFNIRMRNCYSHLWLFRANNNIIRGCEFYEAGRSILHIKGLSRFNVIEDCVLHHSRMDTSIFQPSEGIYVGTDIASWGSLTFGLTNNGTGVATDPDDSSFNIIRRNYIYNTYTENIEFKEGTRCNIATENVLDGTGMRTDVTTDSKNIMCKGNFCQIYHNFIIVPGSDAISLTNASDNSIGPTDNYIGPNLYDYSAPSVTPDKGIDAGTLAINNIINPDQRVIAGTPPSPFLATNLEYKREGTEIVVTVTATYTARAVDEIVLANATSAAFTVNLPTAVGIKGKKLTIKKIDSSGNAVTLDPNASQTIDGASTVALSTQWAYKTLVSDGTNWLTVGQ